MQFAYTAKSTTGGTSSGVMVADSPAQVQQQLRQQGLFVLSVRQVTGPQASSQAASPVPVAPVTPWRRRVSGKDLMSVTSQLAIMTKAGIDMAGALAGLARQCTHPALKATLESVHQDVLGGKSVSAAMKSHPRVFPAAYVATVAAGEASGQLPEVLDRLAKLLRTEQRLKSTRRALLAYPIVLSAVSALVMIGLMFFVLPQFAEVFANFGMSLPALTEALLGLSRELTDRWWLWIGLATAAAIGIRMWRSQPAGRKTWDRWMLQAAWIRDITRTLLTGRAFRLMGIMLESGVPLVEALALTRASIQNSVFAELFDRLRDDVLNGRALAESLSGTPFVPPGATEMISTAERTGTLGTVAQLIGEHFEEEGETRLRELAAMAEPVIIIVMGIIVAVVVLSVVLPMFDFATLAQHGS